MRKSLLPAAALLAGGIGGAAAADYTIGVMHAMTGPVGFVGTTIVNGAQLAADEINASGLLGEDKIKLIIEDTASDKAQALTLTSQLAADPSVILLFGPTSSVEGMAVAPVANELKVPMFTTAVSSEVLKPGPWVYKGTTTADIEIKPLAEFAVSGLKVKKVAVVYDRQNDSTVSQKNIVVEYLSQNGVEVVSEDGVLGSDTDFSAIATKIVDAEPDAVFISSQAPVGANVIQQLRQAGLPDETRILGSVNLAVPQLLKLAGPAAEGVYLVGDFVPGGMNDEGHAFVAAYKARFGTDPDNYAAVSYTMMKMTALVLKAAGPNPTRETVKDAFLTAIHDVPTILGSGSYTLNADRIVTYGGALLQVKDGAFAAVDQH